MALHENLSGMAVEAINEYLVVAKFCLDSRKSDGGCYGYPATLLLFCVVNAVSGFVDGETVCIDGKERRITKTEPFRVFNHELFGLNLEGNAIKLLENSYRNRLAHNAIIERDAILLPSDEEPAFVTLPVGVGIRVFSFYRLVMGAWSKFPRERITTWETKRELVVAQRNGTKNKGKK